METIYKTKKGIAIVGNEYVESKVFFPEEIDLEVEDYIELLSYCVDVDRVRFYHDAVEAFWANKCLVEKVRGDWAWEEWLRSLDGKNSEEVVNEAEWFQDQMSKAFGVDFWVDLDDWRDVTPNCEMFGEM